MFFSVFFVVAVLLSRAKTALDDAECSSVAIFGELGDLVYIWLDHSESHTDVRLGERSYTGDSALSVELRARERHLSEPRESLARPSFRPFTLKM